MNYRSDHRIVMTLDAGGTNFVFMAIRGNEQLLQEMVLPSYADNLDQCLATLIEGFGAVKARLPEAPVAISFAFPGPANYPEGVIGDLPNLPAFRGGIALGPMLREKFGLPVFINNDGDLYAYGEAIAGFLPHINGLLEKAESPKRYKNLLGLTLGTGFGAGVSHDGNLFTGDNSIAAEIWLERNKLDPSTNVEEHVSIRALRRMYAQETGMRFDEAPSPKDLYEIGMGTKAGNREAALKAFHAMAEAAGDAIANVITIIDGLVVIGGGLSGAAEIFLPHIVQEMNGAYCKPDGAKIRRLAANVYNLENPVELEKFLKGSVKEIPVPGTDRMVQYDPEMRIGVGISKIGTSKAIAIGAYTFALAEMDR